MRLRSLMCSLDGQLIKSKVAVNIPPSVIRLDRQALFSAPVGLALLLDGRLVASERGGNCVRSDPPSVATVDLLCTLSPRCCTGYHYPFSVIQ